MLPGSVKGWVLVMTGSKLPLLLMLVLVSGLGAQTPPDSARAEELRLEIEQRFGERVRTELALTDEQTTRLKATQERFGERRRGQMRQQMERRRALQGQMRPGVQANADSVRKLMDAMHAGRLDMLKIEQDEDKEMSGYLTPVQRAQFQMMRQRFVERVQEVRRERAGMRGQGGAGRPQGRRPPRQDGQRPPR